VALFLHLLFQPVDPLLGIVDRPVDVVQLVADVAAHPAAQRLVDRGDFAVGRLVFAAKALPLVLFRLQRGFQLLDALVHRVKHLHDVVVHR
jgi:hypothetical protein